MKTTLRQMFPAILVLTLFANPVAAAPGDEEAAIEAANRWLELVDSGQFSESWRHSSSVFRQTVSEVQWENSLAVVREPLGKLISRKVVVSRYTEAYPGAPDRRYVVLQYQAVYERKESAIETLMPLYDDGEWRVSGYFIR